LNPKQMILSGHCKSYSFLTLLTVAYIKKFKQIAYSL